MSTLSTFIQFFAALYLTMSIDHIFGTYFWSPSHYKSIENVLTKSKVPDVNKKTILAQERIPTKEKDNVMYLNHASYIFEFLKLDNDAMADYGELARIVITDLHNYAFPIIRYDTGDVGILLPPNEYSNGYPILGKLYGRRFDVCYTTENNPFSPMALGRMFKHIDGVLQWQFVQTMGGEYMVKIIPDKSKEIDTKFIDEQLREIVGNDAKIELVYVEDIPVLNSGKRKMVVNQWKK